MTEKEAKDTSVVEMPVAGLDCPECAVHVQGAVEKLPGVQAVDIFLSSEKAVIRFDPAKVDVPAIRKAVEDAGYSVAGIAEAPSSPSPFAGFTRRILLLFGIVFGAVLFVVVVGEWLGFFEAVTERVPLA